MNVNLKEKIAQIYARKGTREAPARWRIPLLFLALLIPTIAGQLVAAQDHRVAEITCWLSTCIRARSRPMLPRRRGFGSGLRVLRRLKSQTGLASKGHPY